MLTHNIVISVHLLIHVVQWDTKCKYWSLQRSVSIIFRCRLCLRGGILIPNTRKRNRHLALLLTNTLANTLTNTGHLFRRGKAQPRQCAVLAVRQHLVWACMCACLRHGGIAIGIPIIFWGLLFRNNISVYGRSVGVKT